MRPNSTRYRHFPPATASEEKVVAAEGGRIPINFTPVSSIHQSGGAERNNQVYHYYSRGGMLTHQLSYLAWSREILLMLRNIRCLIECFGDSKNVAPNRNGSIEVGKFQ
ncbi:hypothetical protein HAX54_036763 [Datura stramonium]|uniref:Uncharacterized protein n=1 Tax=Datura stramonium TaxID=4076 RepID=A0ABS8VKM1_DATST|nr:hypothetical protein [Datura stramonium]